jgi:hypothetical protein
MLHQSFTEKVQFGKMVDTGGPACRRSNPLYVINSASEARRARFDVQGTRPYPDGSFGALAAFVESGQIRQ